MDYIAFIFFLIMISLFAIIPFFILYGLSDLTYFLLYKIIGYRKKVARENLILSFPEKSIEEIKKLEKRVYRNLADIFLESVKGYTISIKTALKRHKGINTEIIDKYHKEGRSVILAMSHYCNWEWASLSIPEYINHDIFTVYKPIENKYINTFVKKSRGKNRMKLLPLLDTYKYFRKYSNKPSTFILVSDQNPSNVKRAVWVDFLGRKTAFLHGIEYYSRVFNMPVIYMHIERKKRGYYEFNFSLIHDDPKSLKQGEMTQLYANKVEEDILKDPANWLWTHKRWKHKWEEQKQK